jgi:hypothetical protein
MSEENNTNQATPSAPAPHPYALPQYAQQRQAEVQQQQINISDIMSEMHKMKTENETLSQKLSDPKYKNMDTILADMENAKKVAETQAASHREYAYSQYTKRLETLTEQERKIADLTADKFKDNPLEGHRQIDLLEAMKKAMSEQAKAQVAEDVTQAGAQPQTGVKPPSNFAEANALYLRMIKGKQ